VKNSRSSRFLKILNFSKISSLFEIPEIFSKPCEKSSGEPRKDTGKNEREKI
jgi:hypothetical protein